MSRKKKSAQERFEQRTQDIEAKLNKIKRTSEDVANAQQQLQDIAKGYVASAAPQPVIHGSQLPNSQLGAAVARSAVGMQSLSKAMQQVVSGIGSVPTPVPTQSEHARLKAEDVIEKLLQHHARWDDINNIDINVLALALVEVGLGEPVAPVIRAGQAPTALQKRKPRCPRHDKGMKFDPNDAMWHCTTDECGVTAYQVKDGIDGDPQRPQVIQGKVDFLVAKTDDGEHTYMRIRSSGLLIDITPQLATIDQHTVKSNQGGTFTQLQVTYDADLVYVDFTSAS